MTIGIGRARRRNSSKILIFSAALPGARRRH
jgi:hypothetical protein